MQKKLSDAKVKLLEMPNSETDTRVNQQWEFPFTGSSDLMRRSNMITSLYQTHENTSLGDSIEVYNLEGTENTAQDDVKAAAPAFKAPQAP